MTTRPNPFEYESANDFSHNALLDYYIEDFNYSRFLLSKRNILLVGERGCGKSMSLLYSSWPVQHLKAQRDGGTGSTPDLGLVGVYVPCNTPLTHKSDYQLLPPGEAAVVSEHFLVLAIAFAVMDTLGQIPEVLAGTDATALQKEVEFILDTKLPEGMPFFDCIKAFIQREMLETQRTINDRATTSVSYGHTFSFASVIVPLLGVTRKIPALKQSHFVIMVDDAHDLNEHQKRAVNSWMAYRDHSLFSFKVALASITPSTLRTSSGGSVLEGHDYLQLDMVQPFQNEASDFGKLADRLIRRRLKMVGFEGSPTEFFPMSEQLRADLEFAEKKVRADAVAKYGDDSSRISDYVYKYKRAQYFRDRSPRANRPEYAGFDTLVFLSTGVIRNLLIPPYWMYDKMLSIVADSRQPGTVASVPPAVQSEIILERSRKLWDWLRSGIDQNIEGCSRQDAERAYRMLDNLAILFRERLLRHRSEPRANSFTLSRQTPELMGKLGPVFDVLRKAQLLYVRSGSAKERGRRELYYVPNRLLWPERGLDPHGQHARVSISADELWAAADENKPLTMTDEQPLEDGGLFHGG